MIYFSIFNIYLRWIISITLVCWFIKVSPSITHLHFSANVFSNPADNWQSQFSPFFSLWVPTTFHYSLPVSLWLSAEVRPSLLLSSTVIISLNRLLIYFNLNNDMSKPFVLTHLQTHSSERKHPITWSQWNSLTLQCRMNDMHNSVRFFFL